MIFYVQLLFFSCCTCYGLNYQTVDRDSPVSVIPDPKWHSFENSVEDTDAVAANLTSAYPVLRYCAFTEVYKVFLRRGHQPFELLLLLQHTNGEHLVNFTLNNNDIIFVNGKKYVKTKYNYPGDLTDVHIQHKRQGFIFWSQGDSIDYISIGNGDWDKAIYEWLFVKVNDRPCYEAKVKVIHGSVVFTVDRTYVAFPTEPYDDVFYTPTTTTTTTITTPSDADEEQASSLSPDPVDTVHHESSTTGFLYVVGGVIVLVASIALSFLGFRLGRQIAKKQALKKGLLVS